MNRNIVKFYAILFIMLSSVVLITDCCSSRSMPKSRPRPVSHFRGVITTSSAKITTTNGNGDSTTFTLITTKTTSTVSESQSETTSTVTDPRSGPGPGPGGGGGGGSSRNAGSITSTSTSTTTTNAAGGNAGNSKDQLMRMGKCSLLFEENYCLNGGKCYNFTIANSTMPTCECADGFMGERCESKYLDGTYLSMRKSKIHIETASIYYGAFLALIVVLVLLYFLHCFQSASAASVSKATGSSTSSSKLLKKSKKVARHSMDSPPFETHLLEDSWID
ncbi:protein spitz-like isoform X2 [Topomyia yanbarensis]|uniref:protein spitz-like isoform X2 n=1 Tax=Topomyia yanbarensis TaxID=2498891 RepID=UPI00273AD41A|nr:protein spitz-like isoform X2 [Topomyia yanbarensis]